MEVEENYLELIENHYRNLSVEDSEYYDFYNEQNGIKGINLTFDPDGGPYMEVGKYIIDGKILTRVYTRDGITYFQVNK